MLKSLSKRAVLLICLLSILSLLSAPLPAADKDALPAKPKSEPRSSDLPLQKLVMFNAGVGFFEHSGNVQGDAAVDLKFNVKDINDLLKSMVLQDLGGGRISTVTYGSKDPITKTLQTFAVDLTSNPTLGQILNQLRGEKVALDTSDPLQGVIMGVEKRKKEVGKDKDVVEVEILNLLTADGMRSVNLEQVGRIKLLDEKLDAELRQALQVLAMSHSTDKKTVTLNFLGQGKRPVRVGYIQETPVWKTSYRLVLDDKEQPFLQGWAIVENTTEEDWNQIGLTLISGRPISFIMDLYQPLYVGRPVVEPELFASLRPQTYGQDLANADQEFRKLAAKPAAPAADVAARFAAPAGGVSTRAGLARSNRGDSKKAGEAAFKLDEGVQSLAQAANVGELFQYEIATPVTLERQKSAMLPIVNSSVKGEKLSIYNAAVQAKHPLNGLKLTNSTDLHLMQGPITVFDGGVYAGDAKIEDLQPGTVRLLSYALDLDTEVAPENLGGPQQLLKVSLVKGTLHVSHKHTRTQKFTVKNSGKKAKKVLVEQPVDSAWTLVAPKEPEEKTRNLYRFAVDAQPGKPTVLEVKEERVDNQQFALTNLDENSIVHYIGQQVTSDKVKAALQEVVTRKQKLAKTVQDKQRLEQEIKTVSQEQDRIRQNMAQLDRNADLYKRYVKKFSDQEDLVDKMRTQIETLTTDETKQRQSLDDYLIKLELE